MQLNNLTTTFSTTKKLNTTIFSLFLFSVSLFYLVYRIWKSVFVGRSYCDDSQVLLFVFQNRPKSNGVLSIALTNLHVIVVVTSRTR